MKIKIRKLFFIYFLIFVQNNVIANGLKLERQDCSENYCYDLDFMKEQRFMFGTKSPYPHYTDFDVNREFTVPKCTPLKMWLLVRHGARLPAPGEMENFLELKPLHDLILANFQNQSKTKCRMCSADTELLTNWQYKNNFDIGNINHLLPPGIDDMKRLSQSLLKMFPTLFGQKFSKDQYLFGYASEHRTRFSYFGFVNGLFGDGAFGHVPVPRSVNGHNDTLLQPYTQCKPSIKNSELVDERGQQAHMFATTPAFRQLVRDVSFRLGFNTSLAVETIIIIWDRCKYEQTWHPLDPSPWCVAFLPHHYKYLEYYDEIKFYYKKSYGAPVTLKLACAAINNMLYYLESNDTYKVIGYFIHSTLMQLFYTALGFFKDPDTLRADNFDQMQKRQFHSSVNLPLSSNLAIVKYKCSVDSEPYKVMFMLNQKPLNLSWCPNQLCSLNDIKLKYAHFVAMDCNATFCDPMFQGFNTDSPIRTGKFLTYCCVFGILLCILLKILLNSIHRDDVRIGNANNKKLRA